jgi:hypothetical protein
MTFLMFWWNSHETTIIFKKVVELFFVFLSHIHYQRLPYCGYFKTFVRTSYDLSYVVSAVS